MIAKLKLPALEGVPEIWPEAEFSVSPCGSWPLETVHAYGGIPPEALSVALYTWPTEPLPGGHPPAVKAGAITIAKAAVVLADAESVTFTEKDALDPAVGVPEIRPALLRIKPAGSVPELMDHV